MLMYVHRPTLCQLWITWKICNRHILLAKISWCTSTSPQCVFHTSISHRQSDSASLLARSGVSNFNPLKTMPSQSPTEGKTQMIHYTLSIVVHCSSFKRSWRSYHLGLGLLLCTPVTTIPNLSSPSHSWKQKLDKHEYHYPPASLDIKVIFYYTFITVVHVFITWQTNVVIQNSVISSKEWLGIHITHTYYTQYIDWYKNSVIFYFQACMRFSFMRSRIIKTKSATLPILR